MCFRNAGIQDGGTERAGSERPVRRIPVSSSGAGASGGTSAARTCPFGLCRRRGRSYFDSLGQRCFVEGRGDLQHAVVVLRGDFGGVHAFGQRDGSLDAAIAEFLLQIICIFLLIFFFVLTAHSQIVALKLYL